MIGDNTIRLVTSVFRKGCQFQFGCINDAVWIDFDCFHNQIQIIRISYDGFGCQNCRGTAMNEIDSKTILNMVTENTAWDSAVILEILKKYFRRCKSYLWVDALERYALL